jgi:hypothetical protein
VVGDEAGGEPVEEGWVGGWGAFSAEVVRRGDEPFGEMAEPETVGEDACGEVASGAAGEPVGELETTAACGVGDEVTAEEVGELAGDGVAGVFGFAFFVKTGVDRGGFGDGEGEVWERFASGGVGGCFGGDEPGFDERALGFESGGEGGAADECPVDAIAAGVEFGDR